MSLNTQMTNLAVNTECDALAALANSGFIDIMDSTGAGQPANANTAITTQVVLASLTLNATAFAAAVNGVLTANAITNGVAGHTGTATWFRLYKSDHTTTLWDGTVGTATANLIIASTSITSGQTVSASSLTHTIAKATTGS